MMGHQTLLAPDEVVVARAALVDMVKLLLWSILVWYEFQKSQDPRKPKNNQAQAQPQQNRNLIQQNFPPSNPAQQENIKDFCRKIHQSQKSQNFILSLVFLIFYKQQGVRGVTPGNGSGSVPPFMLQQMILQQQMTQQRSVMTSQMASQDMMRHPGPYDENQHIQKLLNQNKYHQDF